MLFSIGAVFSIAAPQDRMLCCYITVLRDRTRQAAPQFPSENVIFLCAQSPFISRAAGLNGKMSYAQRKLKPWVKSRVSSVKSSPQQGVQQHLTPRRSALCCPSPQPEHYAAGMAGWQPWNKPDPKSLPRNHLLLRLRAATYGASKCCSSIAEDPYLIWMDLASPDTNHRAKTDQAV